MNTGPTSTHDTKLGNVDYVSLIKLLRADTNTNCKTSPKMADSTTMRYVLQKFLKFEITGWLHDFRDNNLKL